jgi:hypothetical protein
MTRTAMTGSPGFISMAVSDVEPLDGQFGRTFSMADPDGYRVTVYEKDQPRFWPPKR